MKFNLKNRPSHRGFAFGDDANKDFVYAMDCIVWFEGCEKELQEKLEFEENQAKKPDREQSMVAHFQIDLIKEILGE